MYMATSSVQTQESSVKEDKNNIAVEIWRKVSFDSFIFILEKNLRLQYIEQRGTRL